MDSITRKSFVGLAQLQIALALALFLPAGTLRWWQAWVFWLVFLAGVLAVTVYFLRRDRALIQRRLAAGPVAEQRPLQKLIQGLASLAFIGVFVLSGLDHRFQWTSVPPAVAVGGDVLIALALGLVFLVFRANSHASATVEVSAGQQVISTGPYAVVRHPMYSGGLLIFIAAPLALGSLIALLTVPPLAGVLVARLTDEEKLLATELPGYQEYRQKVRWRLIPLVW